jgi:hypothetical protein
MEYAQQPVAHCLERMERTVDEVAGAITDLTMLALDEPTFPVLGGMPPDRAAWGIVDGDAR